MVINIVMVMDINMDTGINIDIFSLSHRHDTPLNGSISVITLSPCHDCGITLIELTDEEINKHVDSTIVV
jgi:hypothetical protein